MPEGTTIQFNFIELIISVTVILAGLAVSWGITKNEIKNLGKRLARIENIFDNMINSGMEKRSAQSSFSEAHSPRQLNSSGKKLFIDSGAEKLLNDNKSKWIAELNGRKLDAALEVEQESYKLLMEKMRNPEFRPLQNFVYNNPRFDGHDIAYSDILYIISLELRNAYLSAHPEIIISEEK